MAHKQTGVFVRPAQIEPGTQAKIRGCEHFGCRGGGWHEPDCNGSGMVNRSGDAGLNRAGDIRLPARRHEPRKVE
jgi:hypothetical protein